MNNLDLHIINPIDFISEITTQDNKESHDITLCYEEDEEMNETIAVHHIDYLDFVYLKKSFLNISSADLDFNEIYELDYDTFNSEEILHEKLHVVDAGPYISGRSIVRGNCYSSDCDTYGGYYHQQHFMYQPELKKYIVVERKSYAN